jgi:cytoskeletal protein CcmA (bactofilin family)
MAKDRSISSGTEPTISIIAPGTRITGECEMEGSIRIEGTIEGSVRAGKAIVVSKGGVVEGDLHTQDAVIAGTVRGLIVAESRLEVQGTAVIDGDVRARRMQLEEGAALNGTVQMGELKEPESERPAAPSSRNEVQARGTEVAPAEASGSDDPSDSTSDAADDSEDPEAREAEAAP